MSIFTCRHFAPYPTFYFLYCILTLFFRVFKQWAAELEASAHDEFWNAGNREDGWQVVRARSVQGI